MNLHQLYLASMIILSDLKKKVFFLCHLSLFRDDVNKSYRKLAVLLHPDKSVAPGSEEAFKLLVAARTALLKRC